MPDHFFALLTDGTPRRIALQQDIQEPIRNIFLENGVALYEGKDEILFDGNFKIEEDEVLCVEMDLPPLVVDAANNPIAYHVLDLQQDKIKALFWVENGEYYFQTFDNRKLLQNRNVLFFTNQTYTRLTENAFVIDNTVNGVYRNNRFYFTSYPVANKIFSLMAFYKEATNEDLREFAGHVTISMPDTNWFVDNSDTVMRKQVTLLQKSNILTGADTKKIAKKAQKFKVPLKLDPAGGIIFPQNTRLCKTILYFLNEQVYEGPITRTKFRTNSKTLFNLN